MQTARKTQQNQCSYDSFSKAQLVSLLAEKSKHLDAIEKRVDEQKRVIVKRDQQIQLLEELLRLRKIQKFTASSEKLAFQVSLFDEVELESLISDLTDQLPEDITEELTDDEKSRKRTRKRGFSANLERLRIELSLSEAEKAGAQSTFFTKVKEELEYVPASLKVLEYWQEKAVFAQADSSDTILAAKRPTHPLGKCFATTSLLAQIITAKFADGLPLYRQEGILRRYGGELSRTNMANWIIRLDDVFKPLINLAREEQNNGGYLQADETRMQVLKETGKKAQSDKWMWVIRGGPPNKPAVLFHYDPSRAGSVPVRLLDGFSGVLQADGYSGYGKVCKDNPDIIRIGCWDHARRKFVEASKAADVKHAKGKVAKADVALGQIRKLYALEKKIKDMDHAKKYKARQKIVIPILDDLKIWLEKNISRLPKGGLTHKAIQYTLNQWEYLVGYCEDGRLNISNALAENAIRPFAVGRKAWLFADTPQGAHASATCFSLIETAKANHLEPYSYIKYILDHIGDADTLEKIEALLPWNVPMEKFSKKVNAFDGVNRPI
jgi:transposase